jgi:hypothetical protein
MKMKKGELRRSWGSVGMDVMVRYETVLYCGYIHLFVMDDIRSHNGTYGYRSSAHQPSLFSRNGNEQDSLQPIYVYTCVDELIVSAIHAL